MSPASPLRADRIAPRNTVLHGDCIPVMAALPAASIDFILTDPPYLVHYRSRDGQTIRGDDTADWLEPAYAAMYRVLKENALCLSFYGWHQPNAFTHAWKAAGFQPVGHLVFPKAYAASSRYVAHQHEQAMLLAKGRPPLPQTRISDVREWRYTGNRRHPTEKSPAILEPLVRAFSPAGGLVLDPFCGSGSTLRAARLAERDYLGIEMDSRHYETAFRRLLT
ncbi:DNA methyltransferase [Jiella mangrovi]|uniref:Methyltransferase n=1 Tax=Jiella mangrovi TaxID=2821407 RepID=A0ABS4BNM0_9HYPH|nr:DNA methyltransferase [Jiella mangrovi]MBP0618256.1 DNA methylase [Jiella mangrovi]